MMIILPYLFWNISYLEISWYLIQSLIFFTLMCFTFISFNRWLIYFTLFYYSIVLWDVCHMMSDGNTKTLLPLLRPSERSNPIPSTRRRCQWQGLKIRLRKILRSSKESPIIKKSLKAMATHKPVYFKINLSNWTSSVNQNYFDAARKSRTLLSN